MNWCANAVVGRTSSATILWEKARLAMLRSAGNAPCRRLMLAATFTSAGFMVRKVVIGVSDDLQTWLEQVRDERNRAQVALQNGNDGPMRLWALLYGHLLIAKVEELAEELELLVSAARGVPHTGDNLVMGTLDVAIEDAETALRAPGGDS